MQREKFAEFLELKGDLANLLEHYLDMVTFLLNFGIKMFQYPKKQIVLIPLDQNVFYGAKCFIFPYRIVPINI